MSEQTDWTEPLRRARQAELNAARDERPVLEQKYGQVWDTKQLQEEFEVIGFLAPYCTVIRKSDGQKGSLEFAHAPRLYFNFVSYDSKK